MGNQKAKRQIWETRIKAFQASGQTAVAWCEANEVNRWQLYSWLRKLKKSSASPMPEPKWVTVTADKEQHTKVWPCILREKQYIYRSNRLVRLVSFIGQDVY
jgi:transposase-like protein